MENKTRAQKGAENVLQTMRKGGKLLPVRDGFILCPDCLNHGVRNKIQAVAPDTEATRLRLYCRQCKSRFVVNIAEGQCREDQS